MAFIETEDPYDRLTEAERRALDRAYERPHYVPRRRVSQRDRLAGYRVLETLREKGDLKLPQPPRASDWRVWHGRQAGEKYDVLALTCGLRGKNPETRKVQATRGYKRVAAFRRACERAGRVWWFTICADLFSPDVKQSPVTE